MEERQPEPRAVAPGPIARLYLLVVDQRTGSGWRIPALDGLRGIAAMMVLIAHTHQRARPDASLLWAPIERGGMGGVILFFALSGFLLYLPWLRSEVDGRPAPRFATYAIRRCLRIMPAYYASVIALAILRVVFGDREPVSAQAIALHFLFLPTLSMPIQTVYWTLQVEEFFYWLLPWLHRVRMKIGILPLLAGTVVISTLWGLCALLVPYESAHTWLENTPLFLPAFALGIYTAVLWRDPAGSDGRRLVVIGALAYVALTPLALLVARHNEALSPICEVLFAPAASLVVLGAARGGAPLLEHPVLRFLGGISFSIYLWHMVVIRLVPLPEVVATSFVLRVVVTSALTIPVALMSYLCVERPFLKLRPHQK